MIQALASFFTKIVRRWLPDAFLFAAFITFIVFAGGILSEGKSPVEMLGFWGDGFWSLLAFAIQMVLILVTGYVLAMSKPVRRGLAAIAGLAKNPGQAVILVTVVALAACWINWGFGLIVGALMAKELATRIRGIHYPLLVASAYTGFLVWQAGLSASIPLKVASPGDDALSQLTGGQAISVADTIFSWQVLLVTLILFVTLPILNRMMIPKTEEILEVDPEKLMEPEEVKVKPRADMSPAEKIENSRELFRSLRRWSMGGTGTHRLACSRSPWSASEQGNNGGGMGRCMDQHDSTFLGIASVGDRRPGYPRHHGLLRGGLALGWGRRGYCNASVVMLKR